jgi:hypothetical protein
MQSVDERARHRADHLKRHGSRNRQWRADRYCPFHLVDTVPN